MSYNAAIKHVLMDYRGDMDEARPLHHITAHKTDLHTAVLRYMYQY